MSRSLLSTSLAPFAAAALALGAHAQSACWSAAKITQPGSSGFGAAHAIDGMALAVHDSTSPGTVNVYRLGPSGWALIATLQAPPSSAGFFGSRLSISGDRLVVGASTPFFGLFPPGEAHVYDLTPSGATFAATLLAPDPAVGDSFGREVSISGSRALVSAPWKDEGPFNTGAAYVIVRDASGNWTFEQKLVQPQPDYPLFGTLVRLQGDRAFVATYTVSSASAVGSACFVYERSASGWTLVQTIQPPGADVPNWTLLSMDVDGDRLVFSAGETPSYTTTTLAKVSVYRRVGATWSLQTTLPPPPSANPMTFGYSVDVEGPQVIVTDGYDDALGTNTGAIDVYRESAGTWSLDSQVFPEDMEADIGIGCSQSNGRIVTGAVEPTGVRSVHVYEDAPSSPSPVIAQQSMHELAWWSTQTLLLAGAGFPVGSPAVLTVQGEAPIPATVVDCHHVVVPFTGSLQGVGTKFAALDFGGGSVLPLLTPLTLLPRMNSTFAYADGSGLHVSASIDSVSVEHVALYFTGLPAASYGVPGLHGLAGLQPGTIAFLGAPPTMFGGINDLQVHVPPGAWTSGLLVALQACVVEDTGTTTAFSLTDAPTLTLP